MNFAEQLKAKMQENLRRTAERYLELAKRSLPPEAKQLADSLHIVQEGDNFYVGSSLPGSLKAELDSPNLRRALLEHAEELSRAALS